MTGDNPGVPDLTDTLLDAHLNSRVYGRSRVVVAETGSTMDDARAAEEAGLPDGHVVVADTQSAGRGSRGRTWHSPAGVDLYFSVVARPALSSNAWPLLTLAVGAGVAEALGEASARSATIKWPNDVLLDGKKCAGILVETRSSAGTAPESAIIGVGVNVNRRAFPEADYDLAPTSIALRTGEDAGRAKLLAAVLGAMERHVDLLRREGPSAVVRAVEAQLAFRGQSVRWEGGSGTVQGIAQDGALRVTRALDGVETLLRAGRVLPG